MVDGRGRSATHTGDELPALGRRPHRPRLRGAGQYPGGADGDRRDGRRLRADGRQRWPCASWPHWAQATLRAATGAGEQSAALAVVSPGGGYGGQNDIAVDLRVDDHVDPVAELARLHGLHELLYGEASDADKIPLEGAVAEEVRELLILVGHPPAGDEDGLQTALRAWVAAENLEERWWGEDALDPVVLDHLRRQAAGARAG